jgi:ATP-dependent RNA helicase DOB1
VSQESKLPVNEQEYAESFKFQLMEAVLAWAQGKSFAEIWYVYPPYNFETHDD